MSDHFIRALVRDADVRALAVVATETAREASRRHRAAPTASLILSEALAGALLLARLHKDPMRVTLQITTDGPIRSVVVDADAEGHARGYVRVPAVNFPSDHGPLLEPAFGTGGLVNVLREMRPDKWYQGSIELPDRSIARGVEAYLRASEQVESVVQLHVAPGEDGLPAAAVGVLFQRLPEGNRAAMEVLRARLEEGVLPQLIQECTHGSDHGTVAGGHLLDAIMGGEAGKGGDNLQLLERAAIGFRCRCSRERVERVLVSLGADELQDMIDKDGKAEVTCDFCSEVYRFDRTELVALRGASR